MVKVRVTQIKSAIGCTKDQKETIKCLGLGKINRVREFDANHSIMGMIQKVSHLLKVEEV